MTKHTILEKRKLNLVGRNSQFAILIIPPLQRGNNVLLQGTCLAGESRFLLWVCRHWHTATGAGVGPSFAAWEHAINCQPIAPFAER